MLAHVACASAIVCAAVALGAVSEAGASIEVSAEARGSTLRVDPGGYAEVAWTTGSGERRTLLVSPRGTLTYGGRLPIYGRRSTRQGAPLDPFGRNVYLDSLHDQTWQRMMGILTNRPTGSFSLWIRSYWRGSRYRGAMIGPNWGWTLAPDAAAEAPSSVAASRSTG